MTPELIRRIVCCNSGVSLEDIQSKTFRPELTKARHAYIYLCHTRLSISCAEIGQYINRTHQTISNRFSKIDSSFLNNLDFRTLVDICEADIDRVINEQNNLVDVKTKSRSYLKGLPSNKWVNISDIPQDVASEIVTLIISNTFSRYRKAEFNEFYDKFIIR